MPEAVHVSEGVGVRGPEVGTVGKYGEEKGIGDAVAQRGSPTCHSVGQLFDGGDDGLGQRVPRTQVMGRGEAGSEPVH